MAVPFHYELLGGVAYGVGSLAEPVYWIICIISFYWNKRSIKYIRSVGISSVLALLYHFLLVPRLFAPELANQPVSIAHVFGIIVACLIINGIFLGISRMRRAKKQVHNTETTS